MINKKLKIFCVILLFTQSCVPSLPKIENAPSENIKIPESFSNKDLCETNCKSLKKETLAKKDLRDFFHDKKLEKLINIALKNNQEINILNQKINIASNEVMARQGEYLPKLGIGAGYEYEKVGEFTSQGKSDKATGARDKLNNHQIGLNASWEIDIWKKLRNSAKSSYYEYLSSIEGKNFAVTILVSEIAATYYELAALNEKLEIITENIKNLEKAQKVLKLQQIAARNNSLAVKRFSAELLKNKSHKFELIQERQLTENKLNNLVGRLPKKMNYNFDNFLEIEVSKTSSGLPTDLLNNRPDIKEASLKLTSAKFNVKAVKARFYPSLSIDGNLGYQAFNSAHFLESPSSVFYNIAGNITAPILNRKAIKADYFSANNRRIQAIYDYEKTFIKAYTEVLNQLISLENLDKVFGLKSKQVATLSDSVEISNILFKAARVDYLELLLTKREYLDAKVELIEVKKKQVLAYINLYKALGGGWVGPKTPSRRVTRNK